MDVDAHEILYKNFVIGERNCFGKTEYSVRPGWGGKENLSQRFWYGAESLQEAYDVIDGFEKILEEEKWKKKL